MQVHISSGRAAGRVKAPPSKSMAHRLLICAAMSDGESKISGVSQCADVAATVDCIRALGADCRLDGDTAYVSGIDMRVARPTAALQCRESGSTMRFFVPITWLSGRETTLIGAPSLMRRPMDIYRTIADEKGMTFSQNAETVRAKGPLSSGDFWLAGNVSSQFISGLLFALPMTDGESRIHLIPPVESRSYIDLTLSALRTFGVLAEWENDTTLKIAGKQQYRATDTTVEGDWSNAAFLDAFGLFGGDVTVEGLLENSLQGDRVYRDCFARLSQGVPTIDIGDCPDLGPILFAVAAAKNGATFTGTRRLRIKESDRVAAMAAELAKFGVKTEIGEDSVRVLSATLCAPVAPIEAHNDHRIVMSCAVLLSLVGGSIDGAEAVAKSYPSFFEDLRSLGLEVLRL